MNTKLTFSQSLIVGLTAGLAAAVLNVILFLVLHGAGVFTDSVLIDGKQPLTFVPVIISSMVPLLIGSMIFFLFERFSSKGLRNFSILAIAFLLFSLYSPFTIVGITTAYAIGLILMHLVAASSLLYFLNRKKK